MFHWYEDGKIVTFRGLKNIAISFKVEPHISLWHQNKFVYMLNLTTTRGFRHLVNLVYMLSLKVRHT